MTHGEMRMGMSVLAKALPKNLKKAKKTYEFKKAKHSG
jgi:hypothetical protein